LAAKWRETVRDLRRADIAHGDLQHANVMVTSDARIKLVDYDGMCVPKLVGRRNLEIGVEPYQHPGRNGDTKLSQTLDNFSSLVIHTGLCALAADPGLWQNFVVTPINEKILFRREDFEDPTKSQLFQRLRRSADGEVQRLAAAIAELYRERIDRVPSIEELLGAFDFGQVRSALDRREFDAALGLVDRHGKQDGETPPDLRPRISDARQRVAKLTELARAVETGNEAAMPALAASPLLRDYPAASDALAVARDATLVAPIVQKLEAARRDRRWRDLVRDWDAAQRVLTKPSGRLRKSAARFEADVRKWRAKNEACDRVLKCLRVASPDPQALGAAWWELQALGGHPDCDRDRPRIEAIVKQSAPAASSGAAGSVSPFPVTPVAGARPPATSPPSPPKSRPAQAAPVVLPATGRVGSAGSRSTVATPAPTVAWAPSVATVPAVVPMPAASATTTTAGAARPMGCGAPSSGIDPGLGSATQLFVRALGRALFAFAYRWLPPVRRLADGTSWYRLDAAWRQLSTAMILGTSAGGLAGSLVAQPTAQTLLRGHTYFQGSIEQCFLFGMQIFTQVAPVVIGAAMGLAISRNRWLLRPAWNFRSAAWAVLAGAVGGAVAGIIAGGCAGWGGNGFITGGQQASWTFCGAALLAVLGGMAALAWFSSRSVPNPARLVLGVAVVLASCLVVAVMRAVAMAFPTTEWVALVAAVATGSLAFAVGVALADAMAAVPFLAVSGGGREQRLNLGTRPVAVGGDAERCDVLVRGQMPLACRYWIDAGHICVLDYMTGQPARVAVGDRRTFGSMTVTIRPAECGRVTSPMTPLGSRPASGSRPAWIAAPSSPGSRGAESPSQ
jgi:hypothetical protein